MSEFVIYRFHYDTMVFSLSYRFFLFVLCFIELLFSSPCKPIVCRTSIITRLLLATSNGIDGYCPIAISKGNRLIWVKSEKF